jgi:hypothetical protein
VLNGALVSVFEDTPGGVRSLLSAQKKLALAGVNITINSFGIATYPYKRQALEHYGAKVYPSLAEALSAAGILPN